MMQFVSPQASNALVSHGNDSSHQRNKGGTKDGAQGNRDSEMEGRNQESSGIVCYYCHELGHTKCTCRQTSTQKISMLSQLMTSCCIF